MPLRRPFYLSLADTALLRYVQLRLKSAPVRGPFLFQYKLSTRKPPFARDPPCSAGSSATSSLPFSHCSPLPKPVVGNWIRKSQNHTHGSGPQYEADRIIVTVRTRNISLHMS